MFQFTLNVSYDEVWFHVPYYDPMFQFYFECISRNRRMKLGFTFLNLKMILCFSFTLSVSPGIVR